MNFVEKALLKKIQHKVTALFQLECTVAQMDNALTACADSPKKSWPNPDKIPEGGEVPFSIKNIPIVGRNLNSCIHQGMQTIRSLSQNPAVPRTVINEEELAVFEDFARQAGVGAIGYAKLPRQLIFKERAVLYDTAIVFIMEMDGAAIAKAPSLDTFKMVMSTYSTLGSITNQLADKLRNMGFQVQASHPLGGLVLYPPLAAEAGLGWLGRHGLLITPQFGPRQRIAAIFANISNLPLAETNEHSWIGEFCSHCGKCIKACPVGAILKQPTIHKSGRKTHINRAKCLPVFVKQEGCTVCVKKCAFSQTDYAGLHKAFNSRINS